MAKVILFGEHSVVYGLPAVAVPLLSLRMAAYVEPAGADAGTLTSLGWSGERADVPDRLAAVARAVDVATAFVGHPDARLHVRTESDFPPQRGLGSSAAAAGAVVRAVLDAYDVDATPQQLFDLTQDAERIAHGNPSGLDALTTASPTPVHFQGGVTTALEMNLQAWIVIADSGVEGSTREAVAEVRRQYEASPERTGVLLDTLGEITTGAVGDLGTGDVAALGEKMTGAHHVLVELGVSDDRLDALTVAALDAGAAGAKLTGGGRGGCVIALTATASDADRVAAALEKAGATATWQYAPHLQEVAP